MRPTSRLSWTTLAACALALVWGIAVGHAEVGAVKISRGYGLSFLPLFVMETQGLLQKHAAAGGLANLKVDYLLVDGGSHINDAVLAGTVDIATTGPGGFLTLWAKARGNAKNEVIGLGGSASGGMMMISRVPAMKTLRDVTENDRIAVPGIKTSLGAIILQMAVAKEFGDTAYARLDHLTVGLPYPEAVTAMLSGKTEITAHVASAPFSYKELDSPGMHKVFNSIDLFGHLTSIMAFTTERFRQANPKVTASFIAALGEAVAFCTSNKDEAAQLYASVAKVRTTQAEILRIISDPDLRFAVTPEGIMTYANFLHRVGSMKIKPDSWKDVFVSDVHGLPGS